jgi:hypothetical protein
MLIRDMMTPVWADKKTQRVGTTDMAKLLLAHLTRRS